MNTRLNTSTHDWVNGTDFYQHKLYHMRKLRVKFFLLRSNAQTKIAETLTGTVKVQRRREWKPRAVILCHAHFWSVPFSAFYTRALRDSIMFVIENASMIL